jgi:hypothetical protein
MNRAWVNLYDLVYLPVSGYFQEGEAIADNIASIADDFSSSFEGKWNFIDFTGVLENTFHLNALYNNENIYVDDSKYVMSYEKQTSTDYEVSQMEYLKKNLDERGINLMYVNAPTKYTDDSVFVDEFGVDTYANRNADKFLSRIAEAGIECVDLRTYIAENNLNVRDMFYRTDHHWTTVSGLWASGIIAENLNEKFNYSIDLSTYDTSNYYMVPLENYWLGEQGKKLSKAYIGMDDFIVTVPQFDTDLSITSATMEKYEGSFQVMLGDNCYNRDDLREYDYPNIHYSYFYMGVNGATVHNNKVEEGKILLLGDSYSYVVTPFLSLGMSDVSTLILRECDGDLMEYIDENQFDTVVILYAPFMIGGHDDADSDNYDMFWFDKNEN